MRSLSALCARCVSTSGGKPYWVIVSPYVLIMPGILTFSIQTYFHVIKWLSIFICFLFFGCSNSKAPDESAEGSWQLYDVIPKEEDEADFATVAMMKKQVKDGSFIHLFEDNIYTEVDGSGTFTSGKWDSKHDGSVVIIGKNTRDLKFKREKNQKDEKFASLHLEKAGIIYKYRKTAPPIKKYKEDPFYPANNDWRIKATSPENKEALRKRLAGYFKHLALLLKAAKDRNSQVVSFSYSKGLVKIYNGGIGIYPYSIVPDEWKNTFYNESNAMEAYSIFEDYLQTTSYKGAAVGNWVEDDYNILMSIYADFSK